MSAGCSGSWRGCGPIWRPRGASRCRLCHLRPGSARERPPPPGARQRPTPRPRADQPDMIGTFTDRMQNILQAAEDEAAEIRGKARAAARAEADSVRAELSDLLRQRDGLRAEVARLRGQADALRGGPAGRTGQSGEAGDGDRTAIEHGSGRPSPTPGAGPRPSPSPGRGAGDRPRPSPGPLQPTGGPLPVPSNASRPGSPPRPLRPAGPPAKDHRNDVAAGPLRPAGPPAKDHHNDVAAGPRDRDLQSQPGRPSPAPSGSGSRTGQGPLATNGSQAPVDPAAVTDSAAPRSSGPDGPGWPHGGPPRSGGPTVGMKYGPAAEGGPGFRPAAPHTEGRTTAIPRADRTSGSEASNIFRVAGRPRVEHVRVAGRPDVGRRPPPPACRAGLHPAGGPGSSSAAPTDQRQRISPRRFGVRRIGARPGSSRRGFSRRHLRHPEPSPDPLRPVPDRLVLVRER